MKLTCACLINYKKHKLILAAARHNALPARKCSREKHLSLPVHFPVYHVTMPPIVSGAWVERSVPVSVKKPAISLREKMLDQNLLKHKH